MNTLHPQPLIIERIFEAPLDLVWIREPGGKIFGPKPRQRRPTVCDSAALARGLSPNASALRASDGGNGR